jgi:DNA-binding response OmpR family regulator
VIHSHPSSPRNPLSTDILVVENSPGLRRTIAEALDSEGYRVVSAADGVDALRVLEQAHPWLILMNRKLALMDGQEFIEEVKQRGVRAKIVILTGIDDPYRAVEHFEADGYLEKPFELTELFAVVDQHRPPVT